MVATGEGGGRNAPADFRGQKRSNSSRVSTTGGRWRMDRRFGIGSRKGMRTVDHRFALYMPGLVSAPVENAFFWF